MSVWRNPKFYFTLSLALFFACFLALPLLGLCRFIFFNEAGELVGLQNFHIFFNNPNAGGAFTNSLVMSFWAALLSVLLSFFFAYGIYSLPPLYSRVFGVISSLLLLVPSVVMGVMLIYLFGRQGIFTKNFGWEIGIYGFKGIIIAEILYCFPVLTAYFGLALNNINLKLHEAAKSLGASRSRRFFTLTVPALKPYYFSAFMIAFILAFTDFGAPKVVGGNYNVLATEIFKQVIGMQNINLGAVIALLLLIPSVLFFILNMLFTQTHGDKASKIRVRPVTFKPSDILYGVYCGLISMVILSLIALMFFGSFAQNWPYDLSLSLGSYHINVSGNSLGRLFWLTLGVSFTSALVGTFLCFLSAYLCVREQKMPLLRKIGDFFSLLPNGIPGLVLGLSYIYFFNSPNNPLNVIYNTFFILIAANVVHFFFQPYMAFSNRFLTLTRDYENILKVYGGSWLGFLTRIIAPLASGEILYSMSYLFVNSMVTISALIFLYTPKTRVLSVLMVSKGDEGELASVFAIAVVIFLANIIVKFSLNGIASYITQRGHKESLREQKKSGLLQMRGKEALAAASKALSSLNLTHWMDYATLLGYVRENNFIKGDVNINFGILGAGHLPNLKNELKKLGFDRLYLVVFRGEESHLKASYKGIDLEFYVYTEIPGGMVSTVEDESRFIQKKLPGIELVPIIYKESPQFIPKNSTEYLFAHYGPNFMTPVFHNIDSE